MDEPDTTTRTSTPRRIRIAGLLLAICAVVAVGWFASRSEAPRKLCPADAMLTYDGKAYGRSAAHGCQFVDEHGVVVSP